MKNKNIIFFCGSLILVGVIIATGIYFGRTGKIENITNKSDKNNSENQENVYAISPITENDRILGNPNADIVIIQYSDFRCPYCKSFHPTMERLISEYAKTGDLAWIYRHFPREDAVNPNANSLSKIAAIAAECVGDIAGESKFWEFISDVHTKFPVDYDNKSLEGLAVSLGVKSDAYNQCLTSGKFDEKIKSNIKDGLSIYEYDAEFGTPYNIIITKSGKQIEVSGSQPYTMMKEIIETYKLPDVI